MFLGVYQQGDRVPVRLQCRKADRSLSNAATPPVLAVYGPDGALVERVKMPRDLQGVADGHHRYALPLGEDYATAGLYTLVGQWTTTLGFQGARMWTFFVQEGGHADGAVTALHCYRRPDCTYLVRVTEAGIVHRGRNPR